jgi:hypothetical protein
MRAWKMQGQIDSQHIKEIFIGFTEFKFFYLFALGVYL